MRRHLGSVEHQDATAGFAADAVNQQRFDAVGDGFTAARRRIGCARAALLFAGQRIALRVAGESLASHIQAPFAHLRGEWDHSKPDLTIELWDAREAGVAGPPLAAAHAAGRRWDLHDSMLAASADGRFVSHEVRGCVAWLDRRAHRIAGWFTDADALSLHQRSKPLQMLLALWASDRDLHAVHAALVGRNGGGVLLPGRSGSGKSTAALACLGAGFDFAGDDWIALGRAADQSHIGHGLYGTATLEEQHARRFADLQPLGLHADRNPTRKSLIMLSRVVPERLAGALPVRALALPRVVERPDSTVRPASRRDALLTIVPSSIFTMSPRGGRRDAEHLFGLVARLPAWWLEIGRDLEQIPHRIDAILREVGGS